MDQSPLVIEEVEAGEELVRRFDQSIPVKVAFWVKEGESGRWYLYVASDHIDDKMLDSAYGSVLRLTEEMANLYLDPFQIKLISSSNPLAQAALNILQQYPGRMATRLGVQNFGGISVEGVYIYPASVTTPAP